MFNVIVLLLSITKQYFCKLFYMLSRPLLILWSLLHHYLVFFSTFIVLPIVGFIFYFNYLYEFSLHYFVLLCAQLSSGTASKIYAALKFVILCLLWPYFHGFHVLCSIVCYYFDVVVYFNCMFSCSWLLLILLAFMLNYNSSLFMIWNCCKNNLIHISDSVFDHKFQLHLDIIRKKCVMNK